MLAAYAFAFLRFPFKPLVFAAFMGTLLLPLEVTLLANVQTIRDQGWINSYQALVLPFAATAFGTFLIRQGFKGIPSEMQDATRLDGYGHFAFLWRFAVPLTRPVVASFVVISALQAWNQYLWPQAVIDDSSKQTAQITLRGIVGGEVANANAGVAAALDRGPAGRPPARRLPTPDHPGPDRRGGEGMRRYVGVAAAALALTGALACSEPPTTGGGAAAERRRPARVPARGAGGSRQAGRRQPLVRRPRRHDPAGHAGHGDELQREPERRQGHRQQPGRLLRRGVPQVPERHRLAQPAARHRLPRGRAAAVDDRQRPGAARPSRACSPTATTSTASSPWCGRPTRSTTCSTRATSNVSTPILYYNRAHFARAGLDPDDPPGTLQEVHDAAVALKQAGIPKPLSFKIDRWFFDTWITGVGQDIVNNGNGREAQATEGEVDSETARRPARPSCSR